MKCVNLIVADGDPICLKQNLAQLKARKGINIVAETTDGVELIEAIKRMQVDVVLTGLLLKSIDGIGVLEAFERMRVKRPKTLILSSVTREYMISNAIRLGANYFMLKPANMEFVYRRILQLADLPPAQTDETMYADDIRAFVMGILNRAGIPPARKGHRCLIEGTLLCSADPTYLTCLTDRLYPEIARRCNTTPVCVEHAIRTAIARSWETGVFPRDYMLTAENLDKRPSVGQMIEMLFNFVNSIVQ